jgi:linoleate 8R-lipoxygenase / 9,12-octadecadienoate 8-hydroperoxide 8R-isomerase
LSPIVVALPLRNMPSLSAKLKGVLHSKSHDKISQPRSNGEQYLERHNEPEPRPTSSKSHSSASTSDVKKSEVVLDVLRTTFRLKNLKTVKDIALQQVDGEPVDDKTYLMERIIQLTAELPLTSRTSATLTNTFLNQLWTDLQHPPQSYLGAEYIYRKADGSNNNILWPHLGAAKQPYARTVCPRRIQPVAKPDPGLLFDTLLARKKFKPHPNKISSVLFYVASIVIHDIFHTNHADFAVSDTSSYLDLAPLYGSSSEAQQAVRLMSGGKLKPDCFSDERILGFPPGVGVLLIFFNRFHNHVAENLARIDEGGRFSRILQPPGKPKPPNAEKLYDEALFQTARLVTSGLYINIILRDYVRTILNLNRVDTAWNLDPRSEYANAVYGHKIPEATGNSVSAEFNLIYRWHSCISERDAKWTQATYEKLVGKDPSISMDKFLRALNEWAMKLSSDPLKRDFAGLQRQGNSGFRDEDLARIWTDSVEDVAGSYGANHVPEILKNVEILGIMQSRSWNLASLNEFRAYFKLEPHKTFEDINPDPIIADRLRHLYGHPDNVEIYPGVVVEATKESQTPGSGLCTNFTTSRAILSDAVALVRGDRFYTIDYMPANLTNWGFKEADCNAEIDHGCVFYKLVLNALPQCYTQDSVYAHYPLVIPEENKLILAKLKKTHLYNFDRPCAGLLANAEKRLLRTGTATIALSEDSAAFRLVARIFEHEGLIDAARKFYRSEISELLQSKSYDLAGRRYVNVVDDVFNVAHAKFLAAVFLSHGEQPQGLVDLLTKAHGSMYAREPARRFALSNQDAAARQSFMESAQAVLSGWTKRQHGFHSASNGTLRHHAGEAVRSFIETGPMLEEATTAQILPAAALVFNAQSRAFVETLNHILGPANESHPLESDNGVLSRIALSYTESEKPGAKMTVATTVASLEVLAGLKKLSRAAGPTGRLRRLDSGSEAGYLNLEESTVLMHPQSMLVSWVAE